MSAGSSDRDDGVRQMGHQMNPQFSVFHHVLNRARWSPLEVSRSLLQVLVAPFVGAGGTVEIVIDETLERRWGRKIEPPWALVGSVSRNKMGDD